MSLTFHLLVGPAIVGIVGVTKPEAAVSSFRAPTAVSAATTCGMTTRTFAILVAVKDAAHFIGRMVVKVKALTKGSPGVPCHE